MAVFSFRVARAASVALLASGCVATPPPGPAAWAQIPRLGTLVAVRAVRNDGWRRPVLSALGVPGTDPAGVAIECIVSADDGGTLSVVQPDPGGLRAGMRVAVLPGGQPLAPTRVAVATRGP